MIIEREIISRKQFLCRKGSHPLDAVLILLSGSFWVRMDGQEFVAEAGDIVVFLKDKEFVREIIEPISCIYLQLDHPPQKTSGKLCCREHERIKQSCDYLYQELCFQNRHEVVEHFLRDIFFVQERNAEKSVADDMLMQCYSYLCKHYAEVISLDTLAKIACVSKQTLIAKFRKEFHKTPMALLSEIRIQNSKTMLSETSLSIGEIALLCGFENLYYFSNAFKKSTGFSPSAFRKRINL